LSRARAGSGVAAAREARKNTKTCSICGKRQAAAFRPFCSKACADIDLSRWLGGRYAIPGAPAAPDADSGDEEADENR
jgi:endogenous inhibitor of DNA gyrase (YacG/DUF329 family)